MYLVLVAIVISASAVRITAFVQYDTEHIRQLRKLFFAEVQLGRRRFVGRTDQQPAVGVLQESDIVIADEHRRQIKDHDIGSVDFFDLSQEVLGALGLQQFGGVSSWFGVQSDHQVVTIANKMVRYGYRSLDHLAQTAGSPVSEGLVEGWATQIQVDGNNLQVLLTGQA